LKAAGAASTIGLAGCSGGGGGDSVPTIRYAGITGTELNDLMAMFQQSSYMTENVLENRGEEYEFEFVDVQSTPVVVSTLGSGDADAGLLAYSSLANAIQNEAISGGQSVVAPLTYDGPRYADTYNSTADSEITAVGDIEGNSLGVNGVGSAIDIAARVMLTRNDISLDDVEFREVSFGAMPSTLSEGRVDVGTFIQPFFEMNRDSIQTVFDTTDAFGSFLKIFLTVRDDYLSESPDGIRAWLEDFWTGMEWWTDDSNSEQRLDIAEEVVGLPRPLLESLVQTERGYYHGEDGFSIDPQWLQKPVDGMSEVGFLDDELDMSEYVDNSYLPEAANTEPSFD
jgi:ABC-type nitrate/sulfonate/bicarbonate transport system substrate-binding protein